MFGQELQLATQEGIADAVLFWPDRTGPLPGVLHLPDIGGIREAHRAMARRLAAEGYLAMRLRIRV